MEDRMRWARFRWQRLVSAEASYSREDTFSSARCSTTYQPSKSGGKHRTVIPCLARFDEDYEKVSKSYMNNSIRTTKYTLLNFIPMNLFEQFHRVANLYFLFIVVLNWVPLVEAFQKEITVIPLVVVLTIIAFKDGLEDYRRYNFDKQINNILTKVYSKKHRQYVDKCWKEVHVGDFIRLSCNEIIPADMVLIYSSDPDGICHIETANLDGETNLKQRQVVKGFPEQGFEVNPEKFNSRIECESPNNDLNRFRGFMEHPNKERVGLYKESLLLRGCTIRNTEAVVGIVVYAGHETKAMLNNSGPRYKRSKLERRLNVDVLWSVVLLLLMCLTTAIGHGIWLNNFAEDPPFVVPEPNGKQTHPALAGFYMFWTMIIVLQVLIPISLYVSIEIVKLGQIFFIQNDVDLYNKKLDSTIQCRALNITEDLGQIQYIFSDKTGTLTENKMVFRRCSIAGVEYSHEDNGKRLELYQDVDSDDEEYQTGTLNTKSDLKAQSCKTLTRPRSSSSLNTLTDRCPSLPVGDAQTDTHSPRHMAFSSRMERDVVPDPQLLRKYNLISSPSFMLGESSESGCLETTYIIDFFLALAVCNTVVVSYPNQPRQRARFPDTGRMPLKSLEEIKQLFQRFSVRRFSTPSTLNGTDSPSDSPSSFKSRLNIFKTRTKTPTLVKGKEEHVSGSSQNDQPCENQSPCNTEYQPEVEEAAGSLPSKSESTAMQPGAGELNYEAESPDEAALVHAARAYKCTLRARTPDQLTVHLAAFGDLNFQLLHILPFDSVRKRMSVVVRHPVTGQVVVYSKGADSVVMDLLDSSPKDDIQLEKILSKIKEQTQKHLDDYAREGLRTLCIAYKVLSDAEYEEWLKLHFLAETSIDNREELLLESAVKLEANLILLGATGIVDRLQEGVPETIEALQKAGIKIWVLTGDKQETAINIACSCKLLRPTDKVFTANCNSKDCCEALLNTLIKEIGESVPGPSGGPVSGFSLVIDGKTLEYALHESLEKTFLELTKQCRAVVCCRSTPLQKSQVVKLVREKLEVLALAIGDGANDVSMIQVADVGIGISGQEGMQAVMSSDFAISRFKHLSKLLLVHGHWCYTRLANMVLYFFYKNVAYVNLLFWYQFFCGFSGNTMTNYWILIFFNLLFTSAPPVIYGILDKDLPAETLTRLPELYKSVQSSEAYLPSTFWLTMLDAFYQSIVCFFLPYFVYADSDISVFSFGTPVNTSALLIILLHLVLESKTLTWIHVVILIGSGLFYFVFALIFSATCVTCNSPANPFGIMEQYMSDPVFYLVCVLTTIVALLPRFVYRYVQSILFPTPTCKAAQFDKMAPEECSREFKA
ncbi:phospholipid-transporting ATPase VD-like isoform X1 [Acipenser ruthenus]|uniref:phospholipid-transporting ATPase VD-like isoform X1 n=2 Tax=Acipenser ruthenus TaxID=7906 RepID=UPI002740E908|nr:phospholipid-transporting ATPase VD-like isoform X1 [Acipenser ruthenus]XP_058888639.1 phospholipid-transporting ATPase VD-like isoform X1 [Acipenser ruthenus]XP_058888640.1 phospholipid-transporting ATPase VD-like isoform X1 [Acipenser ruthenus]